MLRSPDTCCSSSTIHYFSVSSPSTLTSLVIPSSSEVLNALYVSHMSTLELQTSLLGFSLTYLGVS